MTVPPRYRLSDAEKDALLVEQAALIERMAARIAELEALVGKPKKTSANSHIPPSQDGPGGKPRKTKRRRKPRPSRPGVARPLAPDPDHTERRLAESCPHCQVGTSKNGSAFGVVVIPLACGRGRKGSWAVKLGYSIFRIATRS